MKALRSLLCAVLLAAFPAWAAEVAQPLEPYRPAPNLTATLRLAGDRHMEQLVRSWADAYRAGHPERDFRIELRGNGTGMPALYLGLADIAFFGRDTIVTDNDGFAHVRKYPHRRIDLGTGSLATPGEATALVLFVHRDNPLTSLTLVQVDAIFSALRKRGAPAAIRTWGALGLGGKWADRPIHLYADDMQSMTGLFFQHAALQDSRMMNWEQFTEFTDIISADGAVTTAAEQSLAALRADPDGLALATLASADDRVKALALAETEGAGAVAPMRESLIARHYPLTRGIFACVDQPPGKALDPKVRDFIRFILSPEGQAITERASHYLPLDTPLAQAQLRKLE